MRFDRNVSILSRLNDFMHTIHGTEKLCAHQSKSFFATAFNETEPSDKNQPWNIKQNNID